MRILKKALLIGSAFFVSGLVIADACPPVQAGEPVSVADIYDGDTVKLSDGRKVRLIGLNAPETKKKNKPAEPYSEQATEHLRQALKSNEVRLLLERDHKDHYGRWLGHLVIADQLVSEGLIKNGLAFHIAIPPNLKFSYCLKQAEVSARNLGKGLWKDNPTRKVASLKNKEAGFRLLEGKLTAAKQIKSGAILEVDDLLAVKMNKTLLDKLGGITKMRQLQGKVVQIRGWVRPKSAHAPAHYQPWFMKLTDPSHIRF